MLLLRHFFRNRVLRITGNDHTYEFSHDSLAVRVFDRLSSREKNLLEVKRFIEQEYDNHLSRAILLDKDDLNYISPFLEDIKLPSEHLKFISNSKKEVNRKRGI